jgi:NitT/TauT family transport system permease protein
VRTVLLPAALPEIITGLRIGFSATLLGTLIGELFASDQGLGFMLIRAMEAHKVLDIMALTLLLATVLALLFANSPYDDWHRQAWAGAFPRDPNPP